MAGELLTADAQLEWRNTVLGSGTAFSTKQIIGWWDLPGQRGGNAPLPNRHGAFPGRKLSTERYVEFHFKTKNTPRAEFPDAIDQLLQITAPDEDPAEEALAVQLDGKPRLCWARVHRRFIPTDKRYTVGYTEGLIVWEATDPRLYSINEETLSTNLATGSVSGLDFSSGGLDFSGGGLDFGGAQQNGVITALNAGHVPTWPAFDIIGPCTGPTITYSGRTLRFKSDFVVLAGQTMTIDTRPTWHTVEISGVSVRQNLIVDQWAPLQPGVSTPISFGAAVYDPASQLVARWRHAWH
jgi:hypothetical protein